MRLLRDTLQRLYACMIFLLMATTGYAQGLSGIVRDENGNGVEFANVVLLSADSCFISGTITDAEGQFKIAMTKNEAILKVSYVGYKDAFVNLGKTASDSLINVTLRKNDILLSEVTVKGNLPLFRQKGNTLTTQVQGTILSKITSISDLLLQIPGVVKGKTGEIETFGKGAPIFFINNREIKSNDELDRLTPSDIKQIEFIASPGAKYRANGRSVIKITTIHNMEGLSLLARSKVSQNERTSYGQSTRLGYQFKNLNITASYDYENYRTKVTQPSVYKLNSEGDNHRYDVNQCGRASDPKLTFVLGMDYTINECNSIGFSWDGSTNKDSEHRSEVLNYALNGNQIQASQIAHSYSNKVTYHHLNAFYILDKNNYTLSSYADYIHNNNDYNQNTNEYVDNGQNINTVSFGDGKQDLSSLKIDYTQKIDKTFNLSFGGDVSYTKSTGYVDISSQSIGNSSYKSQEYRYGAYLELSKIFGKLATKVGVRYEDYIYKYYDLTNQNKKRNDFRNWFPSFSASYSKEGWSNSLSFSSQIVRPTFRQMSNSDYYSNEFMYQHGNPQLKPTRIYQAQWNTGYKFITLTFGYMYKKDFIEAYFDNNDKDNVIFSTYHNVDNIQNLTFMLNLQKRFGRWSPSLTLGLDQPFYKTVYMGQQIRHDSALLYCVLNQQLSLPNNYMISTYIYLNAGGNQGVVKLLPFHNFNLTLQKTFFNDKLTISLQGNDLFRGMKFREHLMINRVNLSQTENYHLWNYSFNVTYKLNSKSTKYRGKNSLGDEIKRL